METLEQIALRVGIEADEYADVALMSKGEFHPDWHTVRDAEFASRLVAELAKQQEPVAWMITFKSPDDPDGFLSNHYHGCNAIADYRTIDPNAKLTELFTHPAPEVEKDAARWMPIETAPKDGTTVLIGRRMEGFGFVKGYGHFEGTDGSFICGWISNGFDRVIGNLGLASPTHWMPLPSAPEAK